MRLGRIGWSAVRSGWLNGLLGVAIGCTAIGAEEPATVEHVARGERYAVEGRFDLALGEYEKARAAGAGSAQFLNRLGELYAQNERLAEAVEVFHLSLQEKPGQLSVYGRLGEVFLAAGLLDSAIHYVSEASRLAPDQSTVRSSLGFLYLQSGEPVLARAQLDTALTLDPANPEAHRYLGYYLTQVDSIEAAIAEYRHLTELVPDHFEAHNNLAFLLAQVGRYEESLASYERAKALAEEPHLVYAVTSRMEEVRAKAMGKMRARCILVGSADEAEDLRQRVAKGEDFAELARQFSLGSSAQEGGDVGYFGPGELLPAFEQAVARLSVGEVGPVVQVPTGFMVIQRLE